MHRYIFGDNDRITQEMINSKDPITGLASGQVHVNVRVGAF